jgi:serine/threonine protein kinase
VIHRDLKPSNVMVGAFSEVQVMDWELARVLRAGRQTVDEARTETIIHTVRSGSEADASRAGSVMVEAGSCAMSVAFSHDGKSLAVGYGF